MTAPAMEPLPTVASDEASAANAEVVGRSPIRIAFDRLKRDPIAVTCAVIVTLFILIAIFADVLCKLFGVDTEVPWANERVDLMTGLPLKGPPNHGFDSEHPFGVSPRTGVDLLALWIMGARTSLLLAFAATILSTIIGVGLGLVAGFVGGVVDAVISFFTDLFLTIPFLLAALALAPILADRFGTDPDRWAQWTFYSLIVILVIFGWMGLARLIRGEVLALREREFVQAARVIGVPTWRILAKEILPNLVAPIVVFFSMSLPAVVAAEAGLSYLGIGVVGRASWGQTIDSATRWWRDYPLYMIEPVLGIVLLVVALNLLGDAIRDALDPKTRR